MAESTQREIQVEVPAEVVARQTESVLEKYQKLARLPGFRRGRVPQTILRQRFAEEIKTEVVEALVPRYFRQEAEKQGLQPVSQPRVTDLNVTEGEPLRFKAQFEVLPQFELADYSGLRIERPDLAVPDEEVDAALGRLREQQATYSTVEEERLLQDGDFAQVTLDGTPVNADEGQNPVHMDEVMVEIGGSNTVNEFSEHLRGARPGDERSFDVSYPEDFSDKRLAGKRLHYALKILGIKRRNIPELDDNLAREISSDFQTLDDLRKRIRESLETDTRHAAEHRGKEQLMESLLHRNDFAVPESMIERQVENRLERGLRAMTLRGMKPEDMRKMDFSRLRAGQHEAAVRDVKSALLLERIAEREGVVVTEDEVSREIDGMALQARQPAEAIRARLEKEGGLERLRNRMRNEKALDLLYQRALASEA
ncbi:MAG: trigger factor [Acidobacteria bacterium]|nr:trigger factor [Acidobacteriota bacterium]